MEQHTLAESETINTENTPRHSLEKLRKDIKATRQNRINASARLLAQERFVQSINIYYSCVAAIVTLLSLIDDAKSFGIASAILTTILAISIVYLNAQKYGTRAQQFQVNYNALQKLLYDVDAELQKDRISDISDYTNRYIDLLQTSENHNYQDHLRSMNLHDKIDRRKAKELKQKAPTKRLVGLEKWQFYGWQTGGYVLKTLFWCAPIVYFIFELTR